MNTSTKYPLPQTIRKRGEHFFGASLDNIHLRVGPLPQDLGARALAVGNEIWLSPGHDDFSKHANLELLGHELTHILQQRQGRVKATGLCSHGQLNNERHLEAEADEMGRRFADGTPCSKYYGDAVGQYQPVVQCSLVVGEKVVTSLSDLSQQANQVIAMTEDGVSWVNWAITEQRNSKRGSKSKLVPCKPT